MSPSKFDRLVRFKSCDGEIYYGEIKDKESTVESLQGQSVIVYKGNNPWDDDFERTTKKEKIDQVYYTVLLCGVESLSNPQSCKGVLRVRNGQLTSVGFMSDFAHANRLRRWR